MRINQEVVSIDESIIHYSKVCKEIGHTDEKIEGYKADLYLDQIQGIDYEPLRFAIDRLKKYRAELEDDRSRAEKDIYDRFEHYYS